MFARNRTASRFGKSAHFPHAYREVAAKICEKSLLYFIYRRSDSIARRSIKVFMFFLLVAYRFYTRNDFLSFCVVWDLY